MSEVRIEHVFKRFGAVTAVDDFNLTVKDGEFVSILGPSGCGKTTTLRMIAGFERATEGEIYIGDSCVSSSEKGTFAPPEKRDIGMVFQSYAVWPHMTVAENVGYPLKIQKVDKETRAKRVQEMLELVHLGEYGERYPHQLSGGQMQRLQIARAVARNPEFYIFDDSFSALDYKTDAKLRKALREHTSNNTTLIVAQRINTIRHADKIIVLDNGRMVGMGTHNHLLDNCETYRALAEAQLKQEELYNA